MDIFLYKKVVEIRPGMGVIYTCSAATAFVVCGAFTSPIATRFTLEICHGTLPDELQYAAEKRPNSIIEAPAGFILRFVGCTARRTGANPAAAPSGCRPGLGRAGRG